ncbi:MAG: sigma-E factor regulatory protein RseB domain-containing protein [Mycobacteriales bacterium]|nr:sigma-E factor regulatory protein RseB domain-containing protein [Mycobacteriales bacterium]
MSRGGLLLVGAGAVLLGLPALPAAARPLPDPASETSPGLQAEADALALLGAAVTAGRARTYSGTQYVASYRHGRASSGTVRLRHVPGLGTDVAVTPTADGADVEQVTRSVRTDLLDERLVGLLAEHYALAITGQDGCAGRTAHVVEARRDDDPTAVAGRFWVDGDSGLVLRREVYDAAGRTTRSSAFTDLRVTGSPVDVRTVQATPGEQLSVDDLDDGWPRALPGAFALVDARTRDGGGGDDGGGGGDHRVMHLSYSDGLSTTSVFAQPGSLDGPPGVGFREELVDGATVWVRDTAPERVVWSAAGKTFTLLSDAPAEAVRAAVTALPHEQPRDGVLDRVGRGASRVAGWINPFG